MAERTPKIQLADILADAEAMAKRLSIEDCCADLGRLMRFEPNLNEPIHRWFRYKEGFSCRLVEYLFKEHIALVGSSISLLDPFCGVATSLLATEEILTRQGFRSITLRGVEINPYVHFVAGTKMGWDRYDPAFIMRASAIATNGLRLRAEPSQPTLSTITNPRFIGSADLRELLELRDKAKVVSRGRPERQPLLLGVAASAENIFNLRKDGRALRYSPKTRNSSVKDEVAETWHMIAEDLQEKPERAGHIDYEIKLGDGRRADKMFANRRFDVILFSPPYLNNIDYTEVYKIELWLLEFLASSQQMLAQRRRTFRSHPSIAFSEVPDASTATIANLLGPSFKRLLHYASEVEKWRAKLFACYFADMLRTLQGCSRLLKPNGRILLVIGNSVHGTGERPIPVAADLWTCKLAPAAGLRVDSLLIGRQMHRRGIGSSLCRESVIVLSKKRP